MKKALSLVLVLIMALSLAACGGVSETETTSEISTQPETLVVPNVVGMDKDEAVKLLEGMGFEVEIKYKHCAFDENDDYYPDKTVLEQEPLQDVVVVNGGKITVTTQTLTDEFETAENDDGTITLLERKSNWNFNNGICTIPNVYEERKVSKIKAQVVNSIYLWNEFQGDKISPVTTVKIPKDVEIIGDIETQLDVVYY